MANVTLTATVHTNGGVVVGRSTDIQTAVTNASADEAAVSADITAALANGTISGDSTALGLVTQIQTDFATLTADLGTAPAAANVVVSYNPSAVVSKNNLRGALAAITKAVEGASDLS